MGRSDVQVNRCRNSVTCGVLRVEGLSAITWVSLPRGLFTTMSVRKATNSVEGSRRVQSHQSWSGGMQMSGPDGFVKERDAIECECWARD
jgi:hypothetical protein